MANDVEKLDGASVPAIPTAPPGLVTPKRQRKRKSDSEVASEKKKEAKVTKNTGTASASGGAIAFVAPLKQPEPAVKIEEEIDLCNDIIKFNVHEEINGEVNIVIFACHRGLACANSAFLRDTYGDHVLAPSAVKGDVDVNGTTSFAFSVVMGYFYTGSIRDDQGRLPHSSILVAVWLLGGRLGIPRVQNLAIRGIEERRAIDNTVQVESLQAIYRQTQSGSALRRLMVDHVAFRMEPTAFENDCRKNRHEYPWELLLDVAAALKHGQTSETRLLPNMELYLVPE